MPPKSPLDKPPSRRPASSRRSSSDKSSKHASKHEVKTDQAQKSKGSMSDSKTGAVSSSREGANVPDVSGPSGAVGASADHERGDEADSDALRSTHSGGEIVNPATEEVERLRSAMHAQLLLSQHRERLARQLGEREPGSNPASPVVGGRARVSPIHEEVLSPSTDEAFASPLPPLDTTSTESARTVKGTQTTHSASVRTPSYPFPPMRTPRQLSYSGHRPFTALSPTVMPSVYSGSLYESGIHDQMLSGSVTPASTLNFQAPGAHQSRHDPNFPTPNLYELSLVLSAEPGLDPWWTTVVHLMRDIYQADRVTLSIPADSTDIENVPWGQKATYDAVQEDELSLTYLPRGSSLIPSSAGTNETSNSEDTNPEESPPMLMPMLDVTRPSLQSRHSFTAYENTKRDPQTITEATRAPSRPSPMQRARSYLSGRPDLPPRVPSRQNAPLSRQSLQDHMTFETENAKQEAAWEGTNDVVNENRGRVFSVLQALDYEADPLIDSSGILRVLERGKVVALTRDYPYLEPDEKSGGSKSSHRSSKSKERISEKPDKGKKPELGSRISSFLGNKSSRRQSRSARQGSDRGKSMPSSTRIFDEGSPPPQPRYEEYEQAPPSPWSQSPAPSPAVHTETTENPFFASATIDEETFNPNTTPLDYAQMSSVEAIGVDRSWTVLHIPLPHPLLSKPIQSFRLDTAVMESKSAARGMKEGQLEDLPESGKTHASDPVKEKRTPIAILSILSSVIPYPSNLRHSLEHLAPHLATSFSLCRHYTNLETEIAGLSRKRPQTTGFGAVAHGGRSIDTRLGLGNLAYSPGDESVPQLPGPGSITSPSDYSGMSRSTAGSPGVTPNWDPSNMGFNRDKRLSGESPGYAAGESYFSSRTKPGVGRIDVGSASSITAARGPAKDHSPVESRFPATVQPIDEKSSLDASVLEHEGIKKTKLEDDARYAPSAAKPEGQSRRERPQESTSAKIEQQDMDPASSAHETPLSPRRQAMRTVSGHGPAKGDKPHTLLHSYGADFGATFQSLPATSAPASKPALIPPKTHSRSASVSIPTDMPPPSDRLKGLMLDSLPAHVFVALPQTGEIVWVNSRYLTYRGQTVADLYRDPWSSIHPDEREEYLKAWSHALRTGEQFSMQVRIRRFDGTYRWFYTRAVGSRDIRGVIVQWYGSHMDIHDQHIAEVKAARQEEIEASEAKHRQLANLIPQIIFAATEDEGVTFANEQWLSYTGQAFNDALGLGFMDYVHPEDLAKCQIPSQHPPTPRKKPHEPSRQPSSSSSGGKSSNKSSNVSEARTETTVRGIHQTLSRNNSSSSESVYELPTANLHELARSGVIKIAADSNGRLSYTTEVRLRRKDGEYRWHLVRCVEVDNISLGSGDGSWFGACTDINDHKLLETKLKEAMDSKSKFLSNMSHEIRTPLIGISGMVSFLQDTTLNDEQMDYTNTIQSSASSLLNIINDILDLSKVDAGMMKLSYEWFHTRSLVEEVNEMVSTMAITKRLELNYIVDTDVPEMVKGDKFRIRQVLLNVIGNAIKFTTVGEVFSRCRVFKDPSAATTDSEIMLEFSVIDTGSGFTQEEADLIFKPFSQIDGSSTRQHGGSGLGLVISRQLVELHGGKMEGSAVPGEGSTFTFTARFGLPTPEDAPEPLSTPLLTKAYSTESSVRSSLGNEPVQQRAMKQAGGNAILANRLMQSQAVDSPRTEPSPGSPAAASSASSDPSVHSARSHRSPRSSVSSLAPSLSHFSEATKAKAKDLSHIKLELPVRVSPAPSSGTRDDTSPSLARGSSSATTPTPSSLSVQGGETLSRQSSVSSADIRHFRPPMYSILLICPQTHSREATTQHIENTLPKDIPHQITPLPSAADAQRLLGGEDPVIFTHIVLNLPSAEEIVALIEQILTYSSLPNTSILVLTDPVQRQEVNKMATAYDYEQLAKDNRVTFIYKPVKPSRFAVIFDPDKERDLSTDRNRSSAQQHVADQKQNYLDVGRRLGNKGLKVLLVEDNVVNQKVLLKFLSKVGIAVELALDGVECTEKVFARPWGFYNLILCDLHMPRKDGYQTCREIREWEACNNLPRKPIIALSANVMADVLDKCVAAGFNSYVTKPVDFKALSGAMSDLLDPGGGSGDVGAGGNGGAKEG